MFYTSYFSNIKKILKCHKRPLYFYSIAGYPPKWYKPELDSRFRTVKGLAPLKFWWIEWHEKFKDDLNSTESQDFYKQKYKDTILDKINIDAYCRMLVNISGENTDIFLLCYENPEDFCHRHIIRKHMNNNGIKCLEWEK